MSCCCFTTVSTGEVAVIENFGRYSRVADAGCVLLMCPCEYVSGRVSLRVQELNVECETKTKDNVNLFTRKNRIFTTNFYFQDPIDQMKAYVFDVIRASLPAMDLDQAFESKDDISTSLKTHLEEVMSGYGFTILQALVTEMVPNSRVRDAMNEINASRRLKEAAAQRAEGEKVVVVKRAEAQAEAMYLSGVGVARQRKAIMDGFRDNLVDFTKYVDNSSTKAILDLLVLNQYFDTLQEVAGNPHTKCVFTSKEGQDIRGGVMQATAAGF